MKRIAILITFCISLVFAEKVLQYKSEMLHPQIVNTSKEFKKVDFLVEYGLESYKPSLRTYKSPYLNDEVLISFSDENLAIFLKHIDKYIEWNDVAIENRVTNDKQIGAVKITLSWEHGHNNWQKQETMMVTHFFSQNENRHQFLLMFYELSFSDGWVTFKQPTMYFKYDDIVKLKEILDPRFAKDAVEKWKEKRLEVDKLFK
ncbi:MAG: hypothetical protein QQN41_06785 [Nitrosopumilus sp.]